MELKMEKEAPVTYSVHLQHTLHGGCIDHKIHGARNECQLLIFKCDIISRGFDSDHTMTARGHSVTGNLQCQFFAKCLWQGLS